MQRGTLGTLAQTRLARERGRQRLVSQAMFAAHFVGWKFNLARHLGLRLRLRLPPGFMLPPAFAG